MDELSGGLGVEVLGDRLADEFAPVVLLLELLPHGFGDADLELFG